MYQDKYEIKNLNSSTKIPDLHPTPLDVRSLRVMSFIDNLYNVDF